MNYFDKEYLKLKYQQLNIYTKCLPIVANHELGKLQIEQCKREIRQKYKQLKNQAIEFECCNRLIYEKDEVYGTEYIKCKFDNIDDAREYCNDTYWANQVYSQYDCTGQRFISAIQVAHMRDDVYLVRIAWSFDI